ncbi:MAG TPA: response regulator [Cyclobacteriaceae bacterium]|nr:response regulator [Cyclobacteriaceae bacterium]
MSEHKKPTILVIDDDEDYLDILKLGLSNEFKILTIGNFHQLEQELQGLSPALILLDKNLGLSAPENIVSTIRSVDTLREVPIIMMSGIDQGKNEPSAEGIEGFMVKPSSFQEVRDRLRETLDRQ